MVFRKVASVQSLGSFTVGSEGAVTKTAATLAPAGENARRSYYLDGDAKINVREKLAKVATKFAISDDPSDYIYEAIRANTVNVPNDNHDGFHRDELLRYDNRLKTAVYLTYREKPHHVNHRTDNPKTARGVILDAHYNDDAPALEWCPSEGCSTKTAERHNRDETGIHCAKCGHTVKDEFVEILVAIDTKKDPVFADGVRTGQLNAGSMGCNCTSTTCNVCRHVAHSRAEFCEHIRSGNKGTYWTRSAGKWRKISASEASREFAQRGMKFKPVDFVHQRANKDGFEVRKAFEYCVGVEFDEYSRVDEPADQKARTREVLSKAASTKYVPTSEELRMESEQLVARARRRQRRAAALENKTAMKFYVVRVDGDPMDTYAAESLDQALSLAMPDAGSTVEYAEIEAEDAGAARLMPDEATQWMPADGSMPSEAGDVTINVDTETPSGDPKVETMEEPGPEQTMEDFTEDQLAPEAPAGPVEEMSPEELGVIPPGASKEGEADEEAQPSNQQDRSASMSTFAEAYRGWRVQVTPKGNAQLVDPGKRPVLLFKAGAEPKSDEDRRAFGREIINHLHAHGILKTAERYDTLYHAKFAQVVDHALDDMKEFADKYTMDSVSEGGDNDMAGVTKGDKPGDVRDDNADDMQLAKTPQVSESGQDRSTDMEDGGEGAPDSSLEAKDSDMRDDPRKEISVGSDSALDDESHDHTERLASLIGKRVAQLGVEDAEPWVVSAMTKEGQSFVLTNRELETKEVLSDVLMKQWMQLDKAPDAESGKYEARLKKVYAAKLDEAKRAADERVAAARKEAIADYQRAIRIVAKRHALNLELSPLKEALGIVLSNPRTAGYEAMTGQPLDYVPIPGELALHLVEAAWKDGGDAETTALLNRAAELMDKDSEYLKAAEGDLSKLAHKVPPVTAASMVSDVDRESEDLRRQASRGNMELVSNGEPSEAPAQGDNDRRARITAAISGGTRVGALTSQYRR